MNGYGRFPRLLLVSLGMLFFVSIVPTYAQTSHPRQADLRMLALWTDKAGEIDDLKMDLLTPQRVHKALVRGANIDAKDRYGRTMLISASGRWDCAKVIQFLLTHEANVNARAGNGVTALIEASSLGNTDMVKLLLAHRAEVNAADQFSSTALMETNEAKITKLLLDKGAKVNASNQIGETALSMAIDRGNQDQVKLLNAHGGVSYAPELRKIQRAPLSPQQQTRANAHLIALWSDHDGSLDINKDYALTPRAVHQALESGADVNAKDTTGGTALIATSHWGDPEVISLLLDHGADIEASNKDGQTALMVAAAGSIVTDLGSNLVGYPDLVTLLLKRGENVNAQDKTGQTALMVAARTGEDRVVRALLKHGADTNLGMTDGTTPLMAALSAPQAFEITSKNLNIGGMQIEGNLEIMHLLLAHGADVNAKDKKGQTALKLATQNRNLWGYEGVAQNKQEQTALTTAMNQHRAQIIQILQAAGAK